MKKGIGPKGLGTSPLKQTKKFAFQNNPYYDKNKIYSQPILTSDGKSGKKLIKGGKDITNTKEGKQHTLLEKKRNLEARQDYEATNKPDIYMADPTGISSWGDAGRAMKHISLMAKTGDWNGKRLLKDGLDIISAIPMGSKVKAASNVALKIAKSSAGRKVARKIASNIIGGVAVDKTSESISQDNINKNKNKSQSPTKLKDSCYNKAKAKYDVFPSAYASGYIAKCRKKKGNIR